MGCTFSWQGCPTVFSPPERLKIPGHIKAAYITKMPQYAVRHKYRGKRLKGVQYEYAAQDYLAGLSLNYVPGFWLRFLDDDGWKYCQPDGLHFDFDRGVITIVEIKLKHTADAWWQTKLLYYRVLSLVFPEPLWRYEFVEVVQWYDCATPFPEELRLVPAPFMHSDKFKVHIWTPR